MSKFTNYWKQNIEKPGASTHSQKWDRCIEEVKAKGNGANAYAVCTSMLGQESFKSSQSPEEFQASMDEYMRKLGISGAGPVPNSLLAEQDLEGKVHKSEGTFAVWYYDSLGARKCAVFPTMLDAQAYCGLINKLGYKGIEILMKDRFTDAGKRLSDAVDEADMVTTAPEIEDLATRIKNIQIKRQKASISERMKEGDAKNKSFKDAWKESKK